MVFVAALYPIEEEDCVKKSINNGDGFYLQREMINNKKWWLDGKLEHMHNLMLYYTNWYTESVYCYLMSDNYFYKSDLANSDHYFLPDIKTGQCGMIVGMPRMPRSYSDYIGDKDKYLHKFMSGDERAFSNEDIEGIFKKFEENNFRENPCCMVYLKGKFDK